MTSNPFLETEDEELQKGFTYRVSTNDGKEMKGVFIGYKLINGKPMPLVGARPVDTKRLIKNCNEMMMIIPCTK